MKINKGLNLDGYAANKENGAFEHAVNVIHNDDYSSVTTNYAFKELSKILESDDYKVVGKLELNDRILIFAVRTTLALCSLYEYNIATDEVTTIFKTSVFKWSVNNPLSIEYLYNNNNELIVLWCNGIDDNSDRVMMLNVDNLPDVISSIGEVTDIRPFYVFNDFKYIIPTLSTSDGGTLKTGSYFISTRYRLPDGSTTNWNPISKSIQIGTKPDETNDISIKVNLTELDSFYNLDIALISYIDNIYNATLIENINISGANLTYYITSESSVIIDYEAILVNTAIYNKAASMKIANNRLRLGGISTFDEELNYQKYANDVVVGYKVANAGTVGGPAFDFGEIYAFYIHFVMKHTGTITKGYHIPGREHLNSIAGFTESAICRDINSPNYDHNFISRTFYKHANEHISKLDLKVDTKDSNSLFKIQIFIDGSPDIQYQRIFNDYDAFLSYTADTVNAISFANFVIGFSENYIDIYHQLSTELYNGITIKVFVGNDFIEVTDELKNLKNDEYHMHGSGSYPTIPLQYWENANEVYPNDKQVYFPTGNVRHHRFPSISAVFANNTIVDNVNSYKLYPDFKNIYIPPHIADKIDGFIISYAKRDNHNRTNYGFASVNAISQFGTTNGIFGSVYVYNNVVNNESAFDRNTNPEFAIDNMLALVNLEIASYKYNPKLTHIKNVGYYKGLYRRNDPNIGFYESGVEDTGDHFLAISRSNMLLNIKAAPETFELNDCKLIDIKTVTEVNTNIGAKDVYNEIGGMPFLVVAPDVNYSHVTDEALPAKASDIRIGNEQSYNIDYDYREPIVQMMKQNHNVYQLSDNIKHISGYYQKINASGVYNISGYVRGDSHLGVSTIHNIAPTLSTSKAFNLTARELWLTMIGEYSTEKANRYEQVWDDNEFKHYTFYYVWNIFDIKLPYSSIIDNYYHYYKNGDDLSNIRWGDVYYTDLFSDLRYKLNHSVNKQNEITTSDILLELSNFEKNMPRAIVHSDVINDLGNNVNAIKTFRPNSIYVMPSEYNEIIGMFGSGTILYIQQRSCLHISKVKDVIKADGIETYLGTGDLFDRLPQEVISTKGDYINCNSIAHIYYTPRGYIIVDLYKRKIYAVGNEAAQAITDGANAQWFDRELNYNTAITKANNPYNNKGCLIGFDAFRNSIYLTIKGTELTYKTLAFSLDNNQWLSMFTFTPIVYLNHTSGLFSMAYTYIYKHNDITNKILTYYRNSEVDSNKAIHSSIIDILFLTNKETSKIYETILLDTNIKTIDNVDIYDKSVDAIMIYNDSQCTGEIDISGYHGDNDWYDVDIRNIDHRWVFNNLRDAVLNSKLAFLNNNKEVNVANVNFDLKDWYEKSEIISNYIVIRLRVNNTLNNKVVINSVSVSARSINN
jgi:hypothetical protein